MNEIVMLIKYSLFELSFINEHIWKNTQYHRANSPQSTHFFLLSLNLKTSVRSGYVMIFVWIPEVGLNVFIILLCDIFLSDLSVLVPSYSLKLSSISLASLIRFIFVTFSLFSSLKVIKDEFDVWYAFTLMILFFFFNFYMFGLLPL